jgi:hypothetical protein
MWDNLLEKTEPASNEVISGTPVAERICTSKRFSMLSFCKKAWGGEVVSCPATGRWGHYLVSVMKPSRSLIA